MGGMDDDKVMPGERLGVQNNSEKQGMYAERWDGAMDDAPEFAGEWGYGEQEEGAAAEASMTENTPEVANELVVEVEDDVELGGANKLTSYGFDTASRVYGLETVLKAVEDTDETGRDAENPIGAIYERIAPTADERVYLYKEIQKDTVYENQYNNDAELYENSRLGITREGELFDRSAEDNLIASEATRAIMALKRLLEILENDERFAELRKKAEAEGKTITEYLVSDRVNPTLSYFFNRVGAELVDLDAEEVAEEIKEIMEEDEDEKTEESEVLSDDVDMDSE